MAPKPPALLGIWLFPYTEEGPGELGDNVMMLDIVLACKRATRGR